MCCGIALQCRRVLLCSFAVGCEDSEDTGFCPLRIMWCAPEQDRNAENLYLCGFPAFALSNGSSLALFVGGVMEIE